LDRKVLSRDVDQILEVWSVVKKLGHALSAFKPDMSVSSFFCVESVP
jgi:hypothetical protein